MDQDMPGAAAPGELPGESPLGRVCLQSAAFGLWRLWPASCSCTFVLNQTVFLRK